MERKCICGGNVDSWKDSETFEDIRKCRRCLITYYLPSGRYELPEERRPSPDGHYDENVIRHGGFTHERR